MKKLLPLFIIAIIWMGHTSAFAKGPFSIITIKDPGIKGEVNVEKNPALLDFFSFADFTKPVEAPAYPGEGYEVTRSWKDSITNAIQSFDQLHYYSATGYVYYDGLLGDAYSEYDGKWYLADTKIKTIFLSEITPKNDFIPKGDFAYITVIGQGLAGELTLTSETFVKDFFAFANFDENKIDPPADYDPDFAFEISRFYIVDSKAAAFDKLVYYPDQGYVFYAAGEAGSPYIEQWFTANPEIEAPFRAALSERARVSLIPAGIFVVLLISFGFIYFRASSKQK